MFFLGQMPGTKKCITDFVLDCMRVFTYYYLKILFGYFISLLFYEES